MSETVSERILDDLHALREVEAPDLRPAVLPELDLADRYGTIHTPLGPMYVAYNARGISAVDRAGDPAEFERAFRLRFRRPVFAVDRLPEGLLRAATERLQGRGMPQFDLRGLSEFEQAVLRKALEIPRGEIRPYSWIAREIGRPRAVRAVGTALAHNPIPLLIPCHRVVRLDGRIGNYGLGGPEKKRAILSAEGIDVDEIEALAREGIRFIGSDTTHVYCHPTCHNARRITPAHRQRFHTIEQAERAGYRACKVCRPA